MPMSRFRSAITVWLCLCAGLGTAGELRYSTVPGADNLPLQIVEAGPESAPGILFIHGWSLSSSSWQQQLESSLAEQFHLVAVDLRGHGNSGKPWSADAYRDSKTWADDIAAVIQATGLEQPVIVAWSYGGHVTMDYVRHYSTDNLAGIVFVGSTGGMQPFPPPDKETAARFARLGALAMSANAGDRLQAAREFVAGMVKTPVAEEILERETAAVLAITPLVRSAMQGRSLDNSDLISELNTPVLFILGDAERTTSPDKIQLLVEAIPAAGMTVYPETGHMPFVERTRRFNAELVRFMAQ